MVAMSSFTFQDRLILRFYAWKRKWRSPHVFNLPEALHQTNRLLICLPDDPDEANQAVTVVLDLMRTLDASSCLLLGSASATGVCQHLPENCEVLTVGPNDRKWTGFPAPELARRITNGGIDAAIDLNPTLTVLSAVLCVQSGAVVRICFQAPLRELFFNIQVALTETLPPDETPAVPQRKDRSLTPGNRYTRLLRTVQQMTGHPLTESP